MPHSRRARAALVVRALALIAATMLFASCRLAAQEDDWPGEADRLMRVLSLAPGMTAAEIGAGRGELTVEMARRLGANGRLFSTEIDEQRRDDIRRAAEAARLSNVTVVEAGAHETNLAEGCCDAVYMREVFHHFTDRAEMAAALRRAIKPGGRLAIVDYPTRNNYGGDCHCIDKAELIRIVTAAGFEVVAQEDRWAGIRYLVVFRRGA